MVAPKGNRFAPSHKTTHEEIARYGHIAALLRGYIAYHNLSPMDFHRRFRLPTKPPSVWGWLGGYSAPGVGPAQIMADQLGVPIGMLRPRQVNDPPAAPVPDPARLRPPPPDPGAGVGAPDMPPTPQPTPQPLALYDHRRSAPGRSPAGFADVMTFRMHSDGTATVTLNANLELTHATSVFRMLLEAGIKPGQHQGAQGSETE